MFRRRMRWWALGVALALVSGVTLWLLMPSRPTYKGRTASQWESEIRHWSYGGGGLSNKGGRWTFWFREAPWWEAWFAHFGAAPKHDTYKMPLMDGDAEAVPILVELLASRDRKARLIAAEALERVGEKAKPAVPGLILALNDSDRDVRDQAGQTLFCIDREAAERAGIE